MQMTRRTALNVPVPVKSTSSSTGDTCLHGHLLLFMRITWSLLVVFSLAVFITSLPVYYTLSQTICTVTACTSWQLSMESAKTLQALGLSSTGYAIMSLLLAGIYALAYYTVALVIVLRKSDDWMAMLVGLMLV